MKAKPFDECYIPEPMSGCWLWTSSLNAGGYGQKGRKVAHRVSYEIHKGPIPVGMCVCHRCDQPSCVNPDHLFLGTRSDNMRDMSRKGRGVNPSAKMNMELAREIRKIRETTGMLYKDIGKMFGINRAAAGSIGRNASWKERS